MFMNNSLEFHLGHVISPIFCILSLVFRSGALPLSHATLHIVVAATHCFDKTVTETVIQENLNPIETGMT